MFNQNTFSDKHHNYLAVPVKNLMAGASRKILSTENKITEEKTEDLSI